MAKQHGIDRFMRANVGGLGSLPPALTVALFRDPIERLLSRYYYDIVRGKIPRGGNRAGGGRGDGVGEEGGKASIADTTQLRAAAVHPHDGSWISAVEVDRLLQWVKGHHADEEVHHYSTVRFSNSYL